MDTSLAWVLSYVTAELGCLSCGKTSNKWDIYLYQTDTEAFSISKLTISIENYLLRTLLK